MFFLLSLLALVSFVVYFYLLGLRFLALIPLLFLIGAFVYFALKTPVSFSKMNISSYSLYIAWSIILLSIFGICSFVGVHFPLSLLRMLVGNALLWILSYILSYEDGKKIFQFGYYLVFLCLLVSGLFILPGTQLLSFLLIILGFQFGFIGFFTYIIGLWVEVENRYFYTLFISGLFFFCLLLVSWIPSLPGALSLISVILTGLYLGLWWFVQKKPIHRDRISVRRILAGERIVTKTFFSNQFLGKMYAFVVDMPQIYRYILEGLNVLVVLVLFGSFVVHWSYMGGISHFFYWVVISFFIGNVMLLKKIEYTSLFQNLFLFLVIHFAVYVSLFSYFESNIQSIVFWSVFWNVFTSLGLFILPSQYQHLFTHKDYWYWIVSSSLSFLVNVFLLLNSGLAGELIFFLLLLYAGVESMLIFYGIKHVNKKFIVD